MNRTAEAHAPTLPDTVRKSLGSGIGGSERKKGSLAAIRTGLPDGRTVASLGDGRGYSSPDRSPIYEGSRKASSAPRRLLPYGCADAQILALRRIFERNIVVALLERPHKFRISTLFCCQVLQHGQILIETGWRVEHQESPGLSIHNTDGVRSPWWNVNRGSYSRRKYVAVYPKLNLSLQNVKRLGVFPVHMQTQAKTRLHTVLCQRKGVGSLRAGQNHRDGIVLPLIDTHMAIVWSNHAGLGWVFMIARSPSL